MKRRLVLAAFLAVIASARAAPGQSTFGAAVVVKRRRPAGTLVRHGAVARACRSRAVTVGVVIRDQVATTMMEIRLRNPGAARQEAELLVPVPDGAVVRGFAFQGQRRRAIGPAAAARRGDARPTIASSPRLATRPCSNLPGSTWSAPASFRSSREGLRRSG